MLPLDTLILVCSFLSGDEVIRLFQCSKHIQRSLTSRQADILFKDLSKRELGVVQKKLFMKPDGPYMCETWLEVYRDWRSELCGHSLEDVKRMKFFWDDLIEELIRQGAIDILNSLQSRTSKAKIEEVENAIFNDDIVNGVVHEDEFGVSHKKRMPSALRLMYRFVNGQRLRFERYGLFGGYTRYGHRCNMTFLPIEEVFSLSFPVRETCRKYAASSSDYFSSSTSIHRDAYKEYHLQDNFLPFAYSSNDTGERKIFIVGGSNTICTTTSLMHLLYCHPIPSKTSCPFLDWLEDYVMCLKSDIYRYEEKHISLYPLTKPSCEDTCACFKLVLNTHLESMQSVVVTKGIEVRAGAVFVPEQSEKGSLNFVYSMRMRLIYDHPSRDPRMMSAKLTFRHWNISPYPGGESQCYDGPGVVGLYPHLHAGNNCSKENFDEGWFVYQSEVVVKAPGGSMNGFMDFDAFDKFGNKYEEIRVLLGDMIFLVPEYIR